MTTSPTTTTPTAWDTNREQINNPTLPAAGVFTPTMQTPNAQEMGTAPQINPTGQSITQAATGTAQTATNPATALQANTYTATAIGNNTPQINAAQGTLDKKSTVKGQYEDLMDFEAGEVPNWAKGAVRTAEQRMAARGISDSTMAGEATTSAILQAAMPIAQQDAQANLTMQMANLNNEQQAIVTNAQMRFNAMLTDQAADNASKQFNATSKQQVETFMASMKANIEQFNATQTNAMTQFNAGQTNALQQFNATLADSREKFNTQNALVIEQSNLQYLRGINTANTQAINQANYVNAQSLLGISNQAMANELQRLRDEAAFTWQSSENAAARAANISMAYLARDMNLQQMDAAQRAQMSSMIGSAVGGVFTNFDKVTTSLGSIFEGIKSWF